MRADVRALRAGTGALLVLAVAACGSGTSASGSGETARFIVVGDFGTGAPQQYLVGQAMQQVCEAYGCDFVIATGDNIYDNPRAANDPQFETKFELPYQNLTQPWYLALSNHDVGTDPVTGADYGDYEIDYAQRTDRLSDKWHMPSRYYSLREGPVEFFFLDTNRMQPDTSSTSSETGWADEQRPWLVAALAASDAPWKFVVGHHPYRTSGGHAVDLLDSYRAKLQGTICGVADAFLTGHDHILQWLEPASDCAGTQLLISGAGGQTPDLTAGSTPEPSYYYAYNTMGFLYVTLTANEWTGSFYNDQAELLFTRTVNRSAP